jgi:ribose transport system ATP-binding protein
MKLFETLGSITRHGSAVLMVSHRLREIFAIANRVTVIRDGRKVRTCAVSEIDKAGLTALIIGRDLDAFVPTAAQPLAGRCLLRTSGLRGRRLKTVDIAVDRGEIVGVAGLLGSGKSELLRILYGGEKRLGGVIQMEGESISFSSPRDGVVHGIGYVPSDRLRGGGFGELNLVENLTVGSLTTARRKFYIGPSKESRGAKTLMEQYGIQPPHPLRQFSTLSGGNQQKLILARVIGLRPRLLLLDEPTQGVDVGAKAEIYQIIRDVAADEGAGVVLASSDAEELVELCHKIVVLDQGRLSAVLQGAAVTEDQLQNAIYGSTGAASA